MATFEQVMQALRNADAAGNAADAKRLAEIAQSMRGQTTAAAQPAMVGPQGEDLSTGPMNPPPAYGDDPYSAAQATPPQKNEFGDVTGEMMSGPIEAFKAYAGGLTDQSKSPTMAAMPENWDPRLKSFYAAFGDAGMAALSALGTGVAGVTGAVSEIVAGDKTQEQRLAGDLLGMQQVAVPELAGVSSVMRASSAASKAAGRLDVPPTPQQAGARAATDLGITPSLGMTGKTGAMTAAGLEKVPLTGGVIGKDMGRVVGEVKDASSKIVARIGVPETGYVAGEALQSGVKDFVERFKGRAETLYNEVGKVIPKETKITAPDTVALIREALEPFKDNPEIFSQLGLGKWESMATGLERGLSWEAATALRSQIGGSVGKITGELANMDQGRLKRVYGALTADLEAAAKAAGPEAAKAWSRATKHYKAGSERIARSLDATVSAKNPERAFEAFSALTKEGRSTSDLTRMRQIKASIPRDDWNTVSASIADRLGKAKAGTQGADGDTFSPGVFLTEWNKLSPDARRILFDPDVESELTKLARVAEQVKAADVERNTSNTGTAAGLLATGAGGMANLPATVTALTLSNITARALTSKFFLTALNKSARGDRAALAAMAKGNGPFKQDAMTILRLSAAEAAQGNRPANDRKAPLRAVGN